MDDEHLEDKGRMLFASGFVFGVMFALLILMVVVATLLQEQGQALLATGTFITLGLSVFLATIVGAGLFLLAFPENAVKIPLGDALHEERRGGNDGPESSQTLEDTRGTDGESIEETPGNDTDVTDEGVSDRNAAGAGQPTKNSND